MRFYGVDYKIPLHRALCFELPLCFEISLYLGKSLCFKILSHFEIPLCFKILSRCCEILCGGLNEILRRKILHGGILSFKFYGLSTRPYVHGLSV